MNAWKPHTYHDSPLVLAQHLLTSAAEMIASLIDETGVPQPDADHPASARREALRRLVPRWHFAMLNDLERNCLFQKAIEEALKPDAHVLDIGSGSGLLAMIAARGGAGRVTSCEAVRPVAQAAERIIADNGLGDLVRIVHKRSDDLVVGSDLPRRVDAIVTEIVDCGLLGEGILPTLRHAREHLLAPGGVIVPRAARLMAAPVESDSIWQLNHVDEACGFDVRHFNEFATSRYFQVRMAAWPYRLLAPPREVLSFDFLSDPLEPGDSTVDLPIRSRGTCHGIAFWFELALDEERTLSNSPANRSSHWLQAFQSFPEPFALTEGDRLEMVVRHTDDLVFFERVR